MLDVPGKMRKPLRWHHALMCTSQPADDHLWPAEKGHLDLHPPLHLADIYIFFAILTVLAGDNVVCGNEAGFIIQFHRIHV